MFHGLCDTVYCWLFQRVVYLPPAGLGTQLLDFLFLCTVKQRSLLRRDQQHLVTVLHLNHTRGLLQQQNGLTHPLYTYIHTHIHTLRMAVII